MLELAGLDVLVDGRCEPRNAVGAGPATTAVVTRLRAVADAAREAGLAVVDPPLARLLDPRIRTP
jgi:hypothetical protein